MRCNAYIDPETGIALQGEKLKEAQWSNAVTPRCTHELSDTDVFCPACGARVEWGAQIECGTTNYDLEGSKQVAGVSGSVSANWGVGFGCSVGVFVFALVIMTGIMVWSVYLSSTFWLLILLCLLCAVVEWSAGCMVDMFPDAGEPMSKEKRSLLRWGCIFLLCIPLVAPAYGFIQGGIESLRCVDKGRVSLTTYFANKSEMNVLTRIGYRWIYHMCWDFGSTEDKILETSPRGLRNFSGVGESTSTEVNADKDHRDEEISRKLDDSTLSMKISTAMLKNDFAEARRLAKQISDKDLREFQNALIENAESLDANQKKLEKDLKEFQDNLKAAEIRESFFGGR